MGEIVYSFDSRWDRPAVTFPGSEKWNLIDAHLVRPGLVANLNGQHMMFLDVFNHWMPLVSKTAALRICQIVGNDNVSVNYMNSFSPYYDKLSKACDANPASFLPLSVCIGTSRLLIEFSREQRKALFSPVGVLTKKRRQGVPDFVYSLCHQPCNHVNVPSLYKFPGRGVIMDFISPLFPDRRSMVTYMWVVGNCVRDPVSRPRCLLLCGPGGSGKSTCLRMMMAALSGVCGLIPDGSLTSTVRGVEQEVAETVMKSRLVTCFELDFDKKDVNMSMFKNVTGGDYVKVGEFMSKATCSMAVATNGLPNIERQPEFTSDALSRRVICVRMDVDTADAPFEPDPSDSTDKVDFLCACLYIRMCYNNVPVSPDNLLLTLCGNKYFVARRYIREEVSLPVTFLQGRAVLSLLGAILLCDTAVIVNRCRLISMSCISDTEGGTLIRGLVPMEGWMK